VLWACRGNGFITDTNIIKNYGLSDANPFFRELISKPYVHKVCPRACCLGSIVIMCLSSGTSSMHGAAGCDQLYATALLSPESACHECVYVLSTAQHRGSATSLLI
jgi:hypothetical protein